MRPTRKVRRNAKRLFRLCLADDGVLDEDRARQVVRRVALHRGRSRFAVLDEFRRLLRRDRARHAATVETAVPLSPALRTTLERGLQKAYGPGLATSFGDRPDLLAGMRVRVGSTVYDGTVRGALDALQSHL